MIRRAMGSVYDRVQSLDPALRYSLAIYLAVRALSSLWAALLLWVANPVTGPHPIYRPYRGVPPIEGGLLELLLGAWQRWDTLWYLSIADHGYTLPGEAHFPPLYPLLIRLFTPLSLGNSLVAALLISNLALILALWFFYRLAESEMDSGVARKGTLYLALYPTSFFLIAGYSESVFLLLAIVAFRAMRRGRWMTAGVSAAVATLARLQGVAILVPLLYEYVRREGMRFPRSGREIIGLLAIPASALLYLFLRLLVGAEVIPTREPQLFAKLVAPWENLLYSLQTIVSGHFHQADLLNLSALALFSVLTVLAWRRLPHRYALYMAAGLALLSLRWVEGQPLNSMSRYVLGLFPGFMVLGLLGRHPVAHRFILYPSVALFLYLLGQFVMWGWVA